MVRVRPYIRERYDRDILYILWQLIEEHPEDWREIFWSDAEDWPWPEEWFGDLSYFIGYLTNPKDHKVIFFVIDEKENRLIGFTWFNNINIKEATCDSNIWMHRAYRGARTIEAMEKSVKMMFAAGIETIYGTTKNAKSRNNAIKRCGWTQESFEKGVYHLKLEREAWLSHVEK